MSEDFVIDLSFPHNWEAEVLQMQPLILPRRRFIYPKEAEEIERGALHVMVDPEGAPAFLAVCALGFSDPIVPTGVWATPHEDWLCAVAGGYAYLIDTTKPHQFEEAPFRPVLSVTVLEQHKRLLFGGHYTLSAWGREGFAWQTEKLSSEGIEILSIDGDILRGRGWDMRSDQDIDFEIDLTTGKRIDNGVSPA